MNRGLAEGDQGAWPGPGTPAARLMDEGGMHPLLLAALSASDTAAWHTDLVSRERWWSGHMFSMHGLQPGLPVPADYLDLVLPEDRPAVEAAFRASLQTGSHRVDYRVRWPDGSVHWLEGRGHAMRGGDGKTVAISGVCQLIDARKREEADLGFRAQASLELARSIDYEDTLRRIAAMAVPHFADWCAVDMLDGQGVLRRLAVAHTDPGKHDLARTLHEHYPPSPDDTGGVWQVLRSGEPELVAELTDEMLALGARDERHLALLRSLGLRSYMGVPISGAGGGALGVITFVSAESARVYGTRELDLATDLAARAALAVRNATVFQQLQHSQRRQDFLLRLTDVLRGGGSTAQVLHKVSEMVGRHFGVSRAGYGDVDEHLDRIDYDVCWTDGTTAPLLGRFPASAFGPQVIEQLRGGHTVAIGDVRDHPLTSEVATIQTSHEVDTRAILVVPLFKAGRLRTIVYLNQGPARAWTADEVALMEDVAERTRELIERGRTEDALRASEARWRGLFERMNEGFFVAEAIRDASGRMVDFWFLQANPAFEQLTGVPADSAVGRAVTEAIPGVPRALIDAYAAVLDGNAPGKFEVHVPVLGERWYEARPLRLSDDQFSVMFVEITERKQAELALAESAQRYRTLFESIDEGFCIIQVLFDEAGEPVDYRFMELNPAFGRQTGLCNAQGRTVRDVVPGIEREYIETYARVARTGQTLRFEGHVGAMGRWFDAFAFRVGEPQDARVAVLFTDITERRRVQQALIEREAELLKTQSLARIGSWAWDVASGHITTSPELLNLLGVAPGAQLPPFPEQRGTVYPEDDWDRLDTVVQRAVANGEPYSIDLRVHRGGELVWVMAQGEPVRDEQGRVVALRGSVQDITERKQVEEALREADARKNEFLATLAHELRNPLAPLRNGLMILRKTGAGEPAAVRALELMERQLTQLVRLVDDLLDVSRVSLGKVVMKKSLASLQSVVETALETSRPLIEAAGHHLDLQLPAEPLLLHVDPTRIAQVLSNLLNNAAKYTPCGGCIQLRAALAGPGQLRIEVQDSGLGIPADMLEDVFELFTQVGSALDRSQGGLGIGLSLARRLVELHGGRIHAQSAGAGCGSTFVVELPLADHAVPDAPAAERDGAGGERGRRILVVDDNVDAAETLQMLLALAGHEVHLAHTGVEALAAMERFAPDLAFLDIGLPDLNGYDVARAARRTEAGARMVLVALTGWGAQSDQRLAREAGMDLHLTKPVGAAELATALAVPRASAATVLDPGL